MDSDGHRSTSEDTKKSLQLNLREDIEAKKTVGFYTFVEVVFGVSRETLHDWSATIKEQRWCDDLQIRASLTGFCNASDEELRYAPLANLMNHVIQRARGNLTGVPTKYPIDDIRFNQTDPICVQRGLRNPDLACFRGSWDQFLRKVDGKSAVGLMWSMVLLGIELKYERSLADRQKKVLTARRSPRGAHPVQVGTGVVSERAGSGRAGNKKTAEKVGKKGGKKACKKAGTKASNKRAADEDADDTPAPKRLNTSQLCTEAKERRLGVKEDAATNALQMLSSSCGTRLHAVNITMEDDRLWLWLGDACGLLNTKESISIIDDFEVFCAVVVAIARATPEQLGTLPPMM